MWTYQKSISGLLIFNLNCQKRSWCSKLLTDWNIRVISALQGLIGIVYDRPILLSDIGKKDMAPYVGKLNLALHRTEEIITCTWIMNVNFCPSKAEWIKLRIRHKYRNITFISMPCKYLRILLHNVSWKWIVDCQATRIRLFSLQSREKRQIQCFLMVRYHVFQQ